MVVLHLLGTAEPLYIIASSLARRAERSAERSGVLRLDGTPRHPGRGATRAPRF